MKQRYAMMKEIFASGNILLTAMVLPPLRKARRRAMRHKVSQKKRIHASKQFFG
jgi:hypothetical protein